MSENSHRQRDRRFFIPSLSIFRCELRRFGEKQRKILGELMATTNTLARGKHEERRKQNFLNEKVLSAHVPHADTRTTLSRLLPLLVGENEENHLRWFNTTQAGKIEVTVKEWTAVNLLWNIHRTFCYYKRGETLTFFRGTQWNMLTLRLAVCSSIRESQNLK